MSESVFREKFFTLSKEYFERYKSPKPFVAGTSYIPVSGKVLDHHDLISLIDSSLDLWLTSGRYTEAFEEKLSRFLGTKYALTTNSGSSANLLALTALTSPLLKEKRLQPGDEVITLAAGFPTTVNPIVQNGLIPVFIDSALPYYNFDPTQLEKALSPKTKAVFFAHTLGNPFDLTTVLDFCKEHDLFLIEDCCDALGSTYEGKKVGTFGDLATFSFYPAHHITMGEGGAVVGSKGQLKKIVESFRDWGRDCYCPPGTENTCGKRFCYRWKNLPDGYDHKYVYSHIGYNLKITDMQAAIGCSQLEKLPQFIEERKKNYHSLRAHLLDVESHFALPNHLPNANPSWFGFPITVAGKRRELTSYLEEKRIGTRLLFAGNLTKQPAYESVSYRTVGALPISDTIMNQTFWIGVFPGITEEMLQYMTDTLKQAIEDLSLEPLTEPCVKT